MLVAGPKSAHVIVMEMSMSQPPLKLIGEREAAVALGLSVRTLQAWRCRGNGPPYVKAGKSVRYNPTTLMNWADSRTCAHTAQGTGTPSQR